MVNNYWWSFNSLHNINGIRFKSKSTCWNKEFNNLVGLHCKSINIWKLHRSHHIVFWLPKHSHQQHLRLWIRRLKCDVLPTSLRSQVAEILRFRISWNDSWIRNHAHWCDFILCRLLNGYCLEYNAYYLIRQFLTNDDDLHAFKHCVILRRIWL